MDGGGFAAESGVCGSVGGESDGECVVFSVDRTGWCVWMCILFALCGAGGVLNDGEREKREIEKHSK